MPIGTKTTSTPAKQSMTLAQIRELVSQVHDAREFAKTDLGHDFWHFASADEAVQSAMAVAWTRSFDLADMTHHLRNTEGDAILTWRGGDALPGHIPQWEKGRFDYDRCLAGNEVPESVLRALRAFRTIVNQNAAKPH